MTMRSALQQTGLVTFAVLAAAAWTLYVATQVGASFDWVTWTASEFVGTTAAGGLVGLLVMGLLLVMLVVLYSELTETEPAPQPWPPE